MADDPSHSNFSYEASPQLFLFTSLTAGSSQVITATSRLETILKANRIPFRAVDCATDEKARRIWTRRAGKRKLPGLVREGWILADMDEVEEWNEFGELKERLSAPVDISATEISTSASPAPSTPSESQSHVAPSTGMQKTLPIREALPHQAGAQSSAGSLATTTAPETNEAFLGDDKKENQQGSKAAAGLPATSKPPLTRPTTIQFDSSSSFSNFRGGSALATPTEPITASAGPAHKSGLAAVTANPELLEKEIAAISAEESRGRAHYKDVPHPTLSLGSEFQTPSVATKVKFEQDQLKGDARDGEAAEDTVGD